MFKQNNINYINNKNYRNLIGIYNLEIKKKSKQYFQRIVYSFNTS